MFDCMALLAEYMTSTAVTYACAPGTHTDVRKSRIQEVLGEIRRERQCGMKVYPVNYNTRCILNAISQ